jgi:hypothetical protein
MHKLKLNFKTGKVEHNFSPSSINVTMRVTVPKAQIMSVPASLHTQNGIPCCCPSLSNRSPILF